MTNEGKRIVIIAPVVPFRGGIAHSNTALCKNLSKRNEVLAVSFKRLFPKWLYKGKFQRENKPIPKDLNVIECLDSINPISWLNTIRKIKDFKPDLVIFQWWTIFLFPCYLFISRLLSCEKVVICQCVLPHKQGLFDVFLTKVFFAGIDRFIALAKSEKEDLAKLTNKPSDLLLDTSYGFEEKSISKKMAFKKLGFNRSFILFFGFVRPYKGLKWLLEAFPLVEKNVDLRIVGEFWEKKGYDLNQRNVFVDDRYVSNEEMVLLFKACDVLVLPYESSTQSGIIQVAFELGTPLITTRVGGNTDLITDGFNGMLVEPCDSVALADKINLFYFDDLSEDFSKSMSSPNWTIEKERMVVGK